MLKFQRIISMAAVICAAAALTGSVALAAAKVEPKVGFVDLDRVFSEAPRIKQLEEEVVALEQVLSAKLEIRSHNLMLREAEVTELIDLKANPKPAAADTARISKLSDLERANGEELAKLQGTQNLTDQQRARLKELQDIQKKAKAAGAALTKDYQTQLHSKGNEIHDKEDTEVRAAVGKVAEAKGFTLVLDKSNCLFGGTELTSDVITRLDQAR